MKKTKYNFINLNRQSFQNISYYLYLKSFTILLTLSLVSFSSCTKFLTENLKGSFSTETYYQNQTQALQAINGVYNASHLQIPVTTSGYLAM
jgi:hypothetical protein